MTDLGILHQILDALKSVQLGQIELQKGQAETNERLNRLEQGQAETNERLGVLEQGQAETNKRLDQIELYQGSMMDHQAQDYAQIEVLKDKVASLVQVTEAHGEKLRTL